MDPTQFGNRKKKAHVDWSKEMLQKYVRGDLINIYDMATGNESWIYVYEPESKQQSTILQHQGCQTLKYKGQPSYIFVIYFYVCNLLIIITLELVTTTLQSGLRLSFHHHFCYVC